MISKLGVVLLVVGVLIGVGAYASPQLAVLTLKTQDTTLSVMSALPNSVSSATPSGLTPSEQVSITFTTPPAMPYTSAPSISGATGSLVVQGTGVSVSVSTIAYPITLSPETYAVKIILTASFTPTSNEYGINLAFVWTASLTATGTFLGQTTASPSVYSGSSTNYGVYAQSLRGLGTFGISAPGYPFQYVTPSSNVSMTFSTFPQTITLYYVETNGATVGESEIYVTINGATVVLWSQVNGPVSTTTINGYQAYYTQDSLSAGKYTINGYVTNASSGQATQLMSIGMDFPTVGTGNVFPTLTLGQEISIAFGAIIALIGLALIVRRLV